MLKLIRYKSSDAIDKDCRIYHNVTMKQDHDCIKAGTRFDIAVIYRKDNRIELTRYDGSFDKTWVYDLQGKRIDAYCREGQ